MKPCAVAPSVRVVSDPWEMLASMDANTHSTIRELQMTYFVHQQERISGVIQGSELSDHVLGAKPN